MMCMWSVRRSNAYFKASLLVLLFWNISTVFAQKISLRAENEPLDKVLLGLRDAHQLQVSFNHSELSQHRVSISADYENIEKAFEGVLTGTPFTFSHSNNVYVVFRRPQVIHATVAKVYTISAGIYDAANGEGLPFAVVSINNKQFLTSESGMFFYQTERDSIFRLKVEYLGYTPFDTVLYYSSNLKIGLHTDLQMVAEVKVKGRLIHYASQMGDKAAVLRINPQVANYLPGNGDNAVFNLLRLQPGILASGEYSTELIIWGNYKGQSLIKFDGYRVFGNYNYNDNISAVNPFIVKDIQVNKAAYRAEFGNAVSGIVNMTGMSGAKQGIDIKLNMNTNTFGSSVSVPIGKQNSVVFATRHAYVNWLKHSTIADFFHLNPRFETVSDIVLYPDYSFSDYNLRFSGNVISGVNYYASFFNSADDFHYSYLQNEPTLKLSKSQFETNRQRAGAFSVNFTNENTGSHKFLASWSGLKVRKMDSVSFERPRLKKVAFQNFIHSTDEVSEFSLSYNNTTPARYNSQWLWGTEWLTDKVDLYELNNLNTDTIDAALQCHALTTHLTHRFSVDSTLIIETGMRVSYFTSLKQDFWMPRLSVVYRTGQWELRLAGGTYMQVLQENLKVDKLGNIRYQWMLATVDDVPVLDARHLVWGAKYQYHGFSLLGEIFMKNTYGMARFLNLNKKEVMYVGKARAMGIDVYAKQEYKGSSAWISYTLSWAQEHFSYLKGSYWQQALQDQRHEVKMAALADLHPLYLGANFIWGSGFPDATPNRTEKNDKMPYNRVDVSVIYRIQAPMWRLELGASILNLLDHENFKYENFNRIPRNQLTSFTIYTDAMGFTPTFFLNLVL